MAAIVAGFGAVARNFFTSMTLAVGTPVLAAQAPAAPLKCTAPARVAPRAQAPAPPDQTTKPRRTPEHARTAAPVLRMVAEVPLPGGATRFDYQSFDPSSGLLFIAHLGDGRLVVFDTRERRVVADLPGFPRVHGVWAVPELGRIYASATGAHHVAVVDAKTLSVIARPAGGEYPDGIAYAPGPRRVFVSDEHGRADVVIDARTNRMVGQVALGGEAGNTVYEPGSGCILVAVHERNDLVAIDPATAKIVGRYPVAGAAQPHGVSIDTAGRLAFVASQGNATLAVVDLTTMQTVGSYRVGEDPDVLAFDPGLRRLYVASESGVVTVFNERGTTLQAAGRYQAPHAHSVAVDPGTHEVFLPLADVNGHPVLRIMSPASD
jgi:DNA-binding beta-propeller fold protein YncE